jgi:2-polyprenyl-6-methoxyphenol hydroxylase-like FAD-dependent oxidoreductase
VGAELEREGPPGSATAYTYVKGLVDDAYHNYFRPGAAAGLIPSSGGEANVWVGIPANQLQGGQRLRELFDHLLSTVAPELSQQISTGPRHRRISIFPGRAGFARRAVGPGWALVGDAASFTDPIGAHGMTDAFVAAELLCRALKDVPGEEDALRSYADHRRDVTYPVMTVVEQMATFGWDLPRLQSLHLDLNSAMLAEREAIASPAWSGASNAPST